MTMELQKIHRLLIIAALAVLVCMPSCKDYLDVVPDNIPTVDHAFNNRHEAEGYLFGCVSCRPRVGGPTINAARLGGDEIWYQDPVSGFNPRLWYIARGTQGTTAPLADYWASEQTNYDLQGG